MPNKIDIEKAPHYDNATAQAIIIKSLELLNETIERNSRVTSFQNIIMIVLTVAIVIMTAVMLLG